MGRRIIVRARAQKDLINLYDHISLSNGGPQSAITFIRRIRSVVENLADSPERGRLRDDLQPGLRVLLIDRKVAIAYKVNRDEVVIGRIFYRGRDYMRILGTNAKD
jgi:toxin ParE1/3/4